LQFVRMHEKTEYYGTECENYYYGIS